MGPRSFVSLSNWNATNDKNDDKKPTGIYSFF